MTTEMCGPANLHWNIAPKLMISGEAVLNLRIFWFCS